MGHQKTSAKFGPEYYEIIRSYNRIRYLENFVMVNQPAPLRASQQFQLYSAQSDLRSGARSAAKSGCDENDDGDENGVMNHH